MRLEDTVDLLLSSNNKEKLQAEYYLTLIRYYELEEELLEEAGKPVVGCDPTLIGMLSDQRNAMYQYLKVLRKRCKYRNIEIDKVFE